MTEFPNFESEESKTGVMFLPFLKDLGYWIIGLPDSSN